MLWFLILLSSSFSQCYNLPFSPWAGKAVTAFLTQEKLHLPGSRSEQCPLVVIVLLQVLIISVVLLGFSQHLLAVLLPRDAVPTLRTWEAATANGEGQRTSQWRKQAPAHISAPRNKAGTGDVLTWAFLWQSHSLCNPHLISPSPPLAFLWYLHMSHIKGVDLLKAKLS